MSEKTRVDEEEEAEGEEEEKEEEEHEAKEASLANRQPRGVKMSPCGTEL